MHIVTVVVQPDTSKGAHLCQALPPHQPHTPCRRQLSLAQHTMRAGSPVLSGARGQQLHHTQSTAAQHAPRQRCAGLRQCSPSLPSRQGSQRSYRPLTASLLHPASTSGLRRSCCRPVSSNACTQPYIHGLTGVSQPRLRTYQRVFAATAAQPTTCGGPGGSCQPAPLHIITNRWLL